MLTFESKMLALKHVISYNERNNIITLKIYTSIVNMTRVDNVTRSEVIYKVKKVSEYANNSIT